jgi:hypothetical protein
LLENITSPNKMCVKKYALHSKLFGKSHQKLRDKERVLHRNPSTI